MPLLLFLLLSGALCHAESTAPLFIIQRSLNKNEVHYDVRLQDGQINTVSPIDAYWILNAKDGSREELSGTERRRAYGFKVLKAEKDLFQFTFAPLKKDLISVKKDGKGSFIATLPINGKEAKLDVVFVQTEKGGPIPKVRQIELRGTDLKDGSSVLEQRKF